MTAGSQDADQARKVHIEAAIRRYGTACGCELGSLLMIAAMVFLIAYVALAETGWSVGGTLWRGGAWVIAWATLGKFVGLAYAHTRRRMLRAALRRDYGVSA